MVETPNVVVERDYDGYFEALSKRIVGIAAEKQRPFRFSTVVVTAGPWRCQALSVNKLPNNPGEVNLDFYSALRTGFGYLSERDLEEAAELLLEAQNG